MANHLDSHSDVSQIESVICGANAGLLTRFVISPLDFVKIRVQLQHSTSLLTVIRSTITQEGVRAFWKGNVPAEILYVTFSASQFTTLHGVNHLWSRYEPIRVSEQIQQLIAGGIAGTVATLVSYPCDLLRTRLAADLVSKSALLKEVKQIWRCGGVRGFYHGSMATVVSVFPGMGLFFSSYSYLRNENAKFHMPHWMPQLFTAATLAAIFSKAAVFPLDTIRKHVQVHGSHTVHSLSKAGHGETYSHNFLKAGAQIVAKQGVLGLYRGLTVSLVKAWPGSVFSLMFYEASLKFLRFMEGVSTPTTALE